ncbi:MAG TPA: DUF4124 domain-containing protein [Thiopseudomonas sp.]|nr:DUF4124 domain-containing protein [Thiopseudomonas sp.]
MGLRGLIYLALVLSAVTSNAAFAVEYYRYTDERGVTVINRLGVPPHLIGKGYEVLSEQGRVVRVVPRVPTPEEYRIQQEEKEQARKDRQLLLLYTRLEDIDRARERKVSDLDGQISIAQGNLLSVNSLQTELREQAASQERAGRSVSPQLLQQIKQTSIDQQRLNKQIAGYLRSKEQLESTYQKNRARLVELLKQE